MSPTDSCAACSWTSERQKYCNYKSYVKLFYEAGDRGVWSLGSNLILKDRGASLPTFEVPNIQFVQEKTSIPVPTIIESWEEDEHTLILMKRIAGEPLNKAWPNLSMDEKENIARQTADLILYKPLVAVQSIRISSFLIKCLSFPTVLWDLMMNSGRRWSVVCKKLCPRLRAFDSEVYGGSMWVLQFLTVRKIGSGRHYYGSICRTIVQRVNSGT
ncbi:hypothetical protein AFUB_070980 [Aspergillus fumigatus A1163]|uniref:Aminoglycoside phosphotransferase domain-containing protein n=1 Tax=Aspergillus fumigatus (strain CBS 144.89 / FGSC A1163 / CEA10) TaxID=451804 RepID=B0Y508_ASPFC|nr:hypothetical protein AFUB_070980 [Aspergillus fumigatus A1163]